MHGEVISATISIAHQRCRATSKELKEQTVCPETQHAQLPRLNSTAKMKLNCQDLHKELAALPSSGNMSQLLETLCKARHCVSTSIQRTEALIDRVELQVKEIDALQAYSVYSGNDDDATLAKGEKCLYMRHSGNTVTVDVLEVHWENGEAFYTIFDNGEERNTVRERLVAIRQEMEVASASICSSGIETPTSGPAIIC
mmetsp:Transcript_30992/g.51373  ORF Transcript_30992/g.51373 Transcript_30992/m.51373 type:complete len:199 (+) Transcript_30992:43-639(+)|eukprot:CAMPEP_0119330246 /NCGR_PEP_ID=MMETSP1333-20130426/77829_1 /TAXON_ID=418940 /ORGANISM="Scyphosphaera apsteinii, Strain RCC1455" /LENGTH=198 /DNA_ID=CAMNT_0007339595 /DNA_START=40 /DNA_END=636 /DNA_ORIENTATION=+